jgi:hypothetical protein
MTCALAESIAGKLSKTTKMPCKSYSLPTSACHAGKHLAEIPNSVCSKCYAKKGNYRFNDAGRQARLATLDHPRWVEAMVHLIRESDTLHFRWHDSGDLQHMSHFINIVLVARALPHVKFWLPTQEASLMRNAQSFEWINFPQNLVVRVSSTLIDSDPRKWPWNTSTVHKHREPVGHVCPSPEQGGKCGTCRACCDKGIKNVSYRVH